MTVSLGFNPFLLVLCLLLAAGLTYWVYAKTVPRLAPGRRYLLMSIRFLVLFLILFLLFEPILRRFTTEERPPLLAVLIDQSQSLSLKIEQDDIVELDLAASVRAALQNLPTEDLDGEIEVFAFSSDVRQMNTDLASLDTLAFDGPRTNIAMALDYVRDALADQNLKGVVLVSDGQYNTGRNPLYLAERYPVPIYTVVVGDTTSRRDVQIRRITTNEIGYLGTEVPVQVGIGARDFGAQQVTVSLLYNGQVLDSETLVLPEGTAEVPIDLSFTPEAEGLQRYDVAVTRLAGESTYRNNTEAFRINVLKSKRQILLLGAAPGPDFASLRALLEQDANTEVVAFIQKNRQVFYEGTLPANLGAFDVMVLAGFPGRTADTASLQRIAQAITDGTPALFLMDRQTDLRLVQQYFQEALPASPKTFRRGFVEAALLLTPQGQQHPVLQIEDLQNPKWKRLPPLHFNESRWQVSPDARVLAVTEVRGVPLDDPMLVLRSRGNTRTAMLLAAGTWRWRNVPEDLEAVSLFWPTLLSNLIQWTTTQQDDRPVRISPRMTVFAGGEPVQFSGQAYDESLNPVNDASIEVDVAAPDGKHYPFSMQAVGNGRYVLATGALPEGNYTYTATAQRNGVTLGSDIGSFAVGALTLEFKETFADVALMRQLAQRSGGESLTPQRLGSLPTRLAASGTFTPIVLQEEAETQLWHIYPFLALIILLLTLEWFLRKRSGMV